MLLNNIDWKIIELLAEDAWRSQKEIAEKLKLSQQAVSVRIAALKRNGVIKRATIVLDREKAGHFIPFSLGLSIKSGYNVVEIADKLKENPALDEVWIMTGSHRITARGHAADINELEKVNNAVENIEGVDRVDFQIATKILKSRKFLLE